MATFIRPFHMRLMLTTSLVTFFGIAITATLDIRARNAAGIDSMQRISIALTSNIADGCANYLLTNDYLGLVNHVQKSATLPHIARIQVMDIDGTALIDVTRTAVETSGTFRITPEKFQVPPDEISTLNLDDTGMVVLQPIKRNGLLGWIKIRYDTEENAEMQERAIKNSVVFTLVCMLTAFILIFCITRRPARAIRQLAQFAHSLPTGRGEQYQVDGFSQETEQLGEALNYASRELERMRSNLMDEQSNLHKALKQRTQVEAELRQFNTGLERRVAEEVERSREKDAILIQQARFAMLGEMLMNISHQWRQPLNNIGLQVQEMVFLLKHGELLPGQADLYSDSIMEQLVDLSRTIERFRKFNQPANLQASAMMPIRVVRDTVDLVSSALAEQGIRIIMTGISEVPVNCSPGDFSQCLINIINNARDAIVQKGISDGLIEITVEMTGQTKNRIRIANNGAPIPADIFDRIFDPYVTSKFQGQGVGLGLFIVRQTVEKTMQGSITARNTEFGAEFVMEV